MHYTYSGLTLELGPGDFVKAGDGSGALGIVQQVGSVRIGRRWLPAVTVRGPGGRVDVFLLDGLRVIAPDEDRFLAAARLAQEHAMQEGTETT